MKSDFEFERVVLGIFTGIIGGVGASIFISGFQWEQPVLILVLSPMMYMLIRTIQKQKME